MRPDDQPDRIAGPTMRRAMTLLCLLALSGAAWGALPETLLEGALLQSASLEGGLEVGVYGPRPAGEGEPAVLALALAGSESVTLSSGIVLLAWPRGALTLADAPTPAGFYTPFGQWSPDFDSDARQLLCLNADTQWAMPLMVMAPLAFSGGSGEALDALLLRRPWTHPPADTPFRTTADNDLMGIAFIADETVRSPLDLPTAIRGAHRVLLTIPLVFKDPGRALSLWLACTVNGRPVTHLLTVSLTPRDQAEAPAPASEAPTLAEPEDGAEVSGVVTVSGQSATPGALVVAWLTSGEVESAAAGEAGEEATAPPGETRGVRGGGAQVTALQEGGGARVPALQGGGGVQVPALQEGGGVQAPALQGGGGVSQQVRYISRRDGGFHFELPVPETLKPGDAVTLHVRTEAPGYRSPETVRQLVVKAPDPPAPAEG